MELLNYIRILRKWLWLIVVAVVLAAGSSYIASLLQTPLYRTSTTLIVGQVLQDRTPDAVGIYTSQQLAQTYIQLVNREPILEATVDSLELPFAWTDLRNSVAAVPVEGTQLIEIAVIDANPKRAQAIANEMARQLILQSPTNPDPEVQARLDFIQQELPDLQNKIANARDAISELDIQISEATSARELQEAEQQKLVLSSQISQWQNTYAQLLASIGETNSNYLQVVEPASEPSVPISPRTRNNVILGAAIGLLLAGAAAFLLEYLDDSIRSPEEAKRLVGVPVMAMVAPIKGVDENDRKLVALKDPQNPATEAFRSLRTQIQFSALTSSQNLILVTSAGPHEGKSLTSANLAVLLAQAGMKVLLVDGDLRRPVMHENFDLRQTDGLTELLVEWKQEVRPSFPGETTELAGAPSFELLLDKYCQVVDQPGLSILTSGELPPNPSELLGSIQMDQFLRAAARKFDSVIIDTPPVIAVTDAVLLSRQVDGVLFVIDNEKTRRRMVQRAIENLRTVGARIIGVTINRYDGQGEDPYGYSYYYTQKTGTAPLNGTGKRRAKQKA